MPVHISFELINIIIKIIYIILSYICCIIISLRFIKLLSDFISFINNISCILYRARIFLKVNRRPYFIVTP